MPMIIFNLSLKYTKYNITLLLLRSPGQKICKPIEKWIKFKQKPFQGTLTTFLKLSLQALASELSHQFSLKPSWA